MTLATRLFFWDDWTGAPAPTPAPTQPPAPMPPPPPPGEGGGGGKNKGKHKGRDHLYRNDFPQLDADFWEQRESFLREQHKPPPAPRPSDIDLADTSRETQEAIAALNVERQGIIASVRSAKDAAEMKKYGAQLTSINAKIRALIAQEAVYRLSQ